MMARIRPSAQPECDKCPFSHNALNGRWCNLHKAYTTYVKPPKCNIIHETDD